MAEVKAVPGAEDACAVMQDMLPHLRQRQFCPESGLCEAAPEQLCLGCPGCRRGMLQAETSLKSECADLALRRLGSNQQGGGLR